jgi:hypothetical protein
MTDEEWLAWCDATADQDEPGGPDEDEPDPDGLPGHWEYNLDEIVAECRQISAEEAAAAVRASRLGMPAGLFVGLERRGPGQPGSARRFPGEHLSRAAGFATGMCLDTMPGCNALAGFAAEAAGEDDRYEGASDDEIAGALCAWDRVEAHASARKHAAVAELIRRRPEPGCALEGPTRMPVAWDEFTADELRQILADSRGQAEEILTLAHDLEVKLPGTKAAFRDGILRESKAAIIAAATGVLDPTEARAAEALVLDRAGRLTPAGLRSAIARRDGGRPREGAQAARAGGQGRPGPAMGLADLADRPGEMAGIGPIDPWLARDLARAAARNPRSTWCVTVTDEQGRAIGHGCAKPEATGHRKRRKPGSPDGRDPPGGAREGPGFAFTATGQHGPPGGYGSWRLSTGASGPHLKVALEPIATDGCDHRCEARGHDPGVKLRHLSQVRHATCTGPGCRRPSSQADFEHNVPYEAGGRTCLCNGGPKCRHDHRLKQHPRWKVDQLPDGTFRWTTPSGRQYTTEPTRYLI